MAWSPQTRGGKIRARFQDSRGGKGMSTATQARLLTAEEFAQLPQPPDGSQQELRARTREVWVVVTEDCSVTVCRAGQDQVILSNGETLSGGDVLPGFSCPIAELFP